ncbi:MAG TPA: MlaD family protein [Casimicrobiaceae bacterium]|jgi:phospholipid/cholesterol/gamma-HCH transport system substrate-binding protein|nr:MlaD family protein [Casimicrobiaceae bacterium]
METDKHYFIEGLFIIGIAVAAAFFSVWLVSSGHRDDVIYRIHFAESVSGMALGDPVKFRGVDVGTVKAMALDPADARRVQVDVRLRKEAPVKTDTKATLRLKGITGVVYIELNGGAPKAQSLLAVTPEGQIPEIASEKSSLTTVMDQLPKVIEKFSALEDQTKKVVTDVGEVTGRIKDSPVMKMFPPKEKTTSAPAEKAANAPKEKTGPKR